jgi:opacity protein-like surface antigen
MKIRATLLALAFVAVSSAANAQSGYWWLGMGLNTPTGDAGDAWEAGLGGTAGIGWNLSSMKGWSVQIDGQMAKNNAKVGTGDVSLLGVFGNLAYDFNPGQKWNPLAYGGVGMMSMKATGASSQSEMSWQVGGGLSYMQSKNLMIWADIKYQNIMSDPKNTTFMPISLGISMPWGTP